MATASNRSIPWAYGAVAGVAAYVIEYLLAFLLWSTTEFPATMGGMLREFLTNQVPDWVFAGWLLYNAHFVDIRIEGMMGRSRWNFIDLVTQSSTDILYIVVPGILLVAGVALARAVGARDAGDGALAGATVIVGYLPLAVIGTVVFTAQNGAPVLVQSVLLAGIVYPVAIAAIGGGIAAALD
ncbi:MAG: transporter [Halobacteriaceae archaeon]